MRYQASTLDRETGELVDTDLGDWITITEFGQRMGIGRRRVRHILHHAGLLRPEGQHGRFRLPYEMATAGFGKRHDKPASGRPFDVLSPRAVALLERDWETLVSDHDGELSKVGLVAKASEALASFEAGRISYQLDTTGRIWWVRDHFPDLNHAQIGAVVGVRQPRVSKVLHARGKPCRPKADRSLHGMS